MSLIFKKIPAIMAEVGAIEKGRKNASQGYAFRGIDDFYFAMQPLLAKHGVFFAPNVIRDTREERQTKSGSNMIYTVLAMEFTFYAEDGSSFKASTVGEAMDSGDKSAAKAMSTALKYAFMQLFCVPTEEDSNLDTENDSPEVAPRSGPKGKPDLKAVPGDLGDYVIKIGKKFIGKKLSDCGPFNTDGTPGELLNYADWLEAKAAEKKVVLTGVDLETVQMIRAFAEQRKKVAK